MKLNRIIPAIAFAVATSACTVPVIPAELVPFVAPQAPCETCVTNTDDPGGNVAPQAPGPLGQP